MARRALTDPDEGARDTWAADAPIAQERWGCSAVRDARGRRVYPAHESLDDLDSECRSVAEEVAAITGAAPCADCPMAQARSEGNAWVHVVTRAYKANEKGGLLIRHPQPDAVLIDALDTLADAVDARRAYEDEERDKRLAENKPPPFPFRPEAPDDE